MDRIGLHPTLVEPYNGTPFDFIFYSSYTAVS
jgi:hypothetical protein